MATTAITGVIGTTDSVASLGAEVWIDQTLVIDIAHIDQDTKFSCKVEDDEGLHCLKIVLKNKKPEHTKIDEHGNILQDARLVIKEIAFDEIVLGQTFIDRTVYTHNFNGTQQEATERFYGEMGCNGTVSLEFTSPFYLWLLEHM